jgi:hypothetical protein
MEADQPEDQMTPQSAPEVVKRPNRSPNDNMTLEQQAASRIKATMALSLKAQERFETDRARYLEAYPRIAHFYESRKLMMRELKISEKRLRELETVTGMRLSAAREAARLQAQSTGKKWSKEPERATWLNWPVLKLFDTLMNLFQGTEGDGEEAEKQDDRDPRSSWTAWRIFLAAAFGESQQDIEIDHREVGSEDAGSDVATVPTYPGIPDVTVPRGAAAIPGQASPQEIFEACTGRKTWPTWQSRIVSLIVGRRGGKSYITAIIGIYLALCRQYKLNLGTKGMVMILARDREQAGVIRSYVLAFLKTRPLAGFLASEPTQKLIELTNGITIEIRSVSEAGTRGYTVVAALMDEIAFWPTDANSAKQDKKVLRALRPAMFGIKNAMIVMLSSPYAQRGELYETYKRSYGKDDDRRHLVWQADTLSMRPSDDQELLDEIKAEYEEDPENAKAEYGALFRSDLESLYKKSVVENVCVQGRAERPRVATYTYRGFVDPSGGSSDSYVLAVAHDEVRSIAGEMVKIPVLDKVREWPAPFDPEEVSKEVVEICKAYQVSQVTGDAYGGEWPREPLRKRGVQYALSDKTRSELYLDFLPVVNSGRCELLDRETQKKMVNQFSNLERRTGRTGKDSVDHPPGSHDDVANAVAGVMIATPSIWQLPKGVVW